MAVKSRKIQLGTLTLLLSAAAPAMAAPPVPARPKPFEAAVSLEVSSNLYRPESSSHSSELQALFLPSYRLSSRISLDGRFGLTKELTGLRESKLDDVSISLRHADVALSPWLDWSPRLTGVLPTSEASRKTALLYGGVSLGNRLTLGKQRGFLKDLDGFYQISLARSFHEYTTGLNGESNTMLKLTHRVSLSYSFTDKLSLNGELIQATGWTYAYAPASTFEMSEELGYVVNDSVELAFGHGNSGNVFKENGKDLNLALANGDSSVVYGSVTFKY